MGPFCNRCANEGGLNPLRSHCKLCCTVCLSPTSTTSVSTKPTSATPTTIIICVISFCPCFSIVIALACCARKRRRKGSVGFDSVFPEQIGNQAGNDIELHSVSPRTLKYWYRMLRRSLRRMRTCGNSLRRFWSEAHSSSFHSDRLPFVTASLVDLTVCFPFNAQLQTVNHIPWHSLDMCCYRPRGSYHWLHGAQKLMNDVEQMPCSLKHFFSRCTDLSRTDFAINTFCASTVLRTNVPSPCNLIIFPSIVLIMYS